MNIRKIVVYSVAGGLVASSLALKPQQDPRDIQAFVVKVVRDVSKKSPTRGWEKAIPSDRLRSGYQMRTDDKSLAIIVFSDESKLTVRPRSIVEIKGQKDRGQIVDRSVHVERGRLQFNVQKQEREQFRFSSPISVASIRGTKGGVDHSVVDTTSTFVCTEGSFEVDGSNVNQGQAYKKRGSGGQGEVHDSTPADLNIGDANVTDDEGGDQGQNQGGQKPKLEIIGKDANGKEVKIKIE